MKTKKIQNILKIINVALTIGLFYFAYIYGKSLLSEANFSGLAENWWMLVVSAVCFLAYYGISAFHWLLVSRIAEPDTKPIQSLAYFASQPYKYLPTSIFSFSFRAKYAKQLGLGVKKSSYAQLIENFNIIGSGAVVAVVFFCFSQTYVFGLMSLLLLFIGTYVVWRYKIKLPIPLTKGRRTLHTYKLLPSFYVMTSAWLLAGISFWLVSASLDYSLNIWLAISATAAAFVISILAVFAPGGVGVRELTLALFGVQNSAIVLWRLLTFCTDMIVGFSVIGVIKLKRH